MGLNHKREVLKIIISLCSCLLISAMVWSQEAGASADTASVAVSSEAAETGRAAETQIVIGQDTAAGLDAATVGGSSYGVWFFVRTVLVLAVVLALVWAFFMFLKRASGATDSSDPYLKKVASLTLAPGKFVYVVTLQSRGYIIGVADGSVSLIAEVDDKELIDAMNLNAPQDFEGKGPVDFASILSKFRTGGGKKPAAASKRAGSGFSTSSAVELLQSNRSRLSDAGEGDDGTP